MVDSLPDLSALGLSAEQIAARRSSVGGSDCVTIMRGDDESLMALWREKRGEAKPVDLSRVLAVQLGLWTEPFNLAWYQRETGALLGDLQGVFEVDLGFPLRVTVDAREVMTGRPVDAKHVSARTTPEDAWERYLPQMAAQRIATGAPGSVLSVIRGTQDWFLLEYARDQAYEDALIEACRKFWDCVVFGEPPVPPPPPSQPKPVATRVIDMSGCNFWAANAAEWLETREAFERHEVAKRALKNATPQDAVRAYGHGVLVKRDRRGSLRVMAMTDEEE